MATAGDTSNPQQSGSSASPGESNAAAPLHRWPRGTVWVAIGIVLVSLIIATWAIWQQGIKARYAAIRARGEPITFADLDAAYPTPPAGEDTTHELLAAGNILSASANKPEWRQLPYLGEGPDPPPVGDSWAELKLARGFLEENARPLEQLHKAADLGCQARFEGVASPHGIDVVVSYAGPLRSACRTLCLESMVRLHSGDVPAAAQSLAAALKLERALANEPLGVSQLIRVAIFGAAAHETKRALVVADFSEAELATFQEILIGIDFRSGLKSGFLGERVYDVTGFERGLGLRLSPNRSTAQPWLYEIAGLLDTGRYLDFLEEYVAAADLPWPQMLTECRAIAHRWDSHTSRLATLINAPTPTVLGMVTTSQCRAELTRRLLLVAIALERYRVRHGAAPADLAGLVPEFLAEVPDDPTDGRPLSYRPSASGYVLYSETKDFPLPSGEVYDAETGANPSVMVRRPPLKTPQPKAAE
jgi:hypothetical protein